MRDPKFCYEKFCVFAEFRCGERRDWFFTLNVRSNREKYRVALLRGLGDVFFRGTKTLRRDRARKCELHGWRGRLHGGFEKRRRGGHTREGGQRENANTDESLG